LKIIYVDTKTTII